jgi:hypothetical protein
MFSVFKNGGDKSLLDYMLASVRKTYKLQLLYVYRTYKSPGNHKHCEQRQNQDTDSPTI